MSLSIHRSPAPRAPLPSQPTRVDLSVSENDPALKAEVRGNKKLVILRGTANNRGAVASFLTLEFDGKRVTVKPQRGDTARALREKLAAAMPEGYRIVVPVYVGRTSAELASFEVHKVPRGAGAPNPR